MTPLDAVYTLKKIVENHVQNDVLNELCYEVLNHPGLLGAYGSSGSHHAYLGGLAVHLCEVVNYALGMAEMFPTASKEAIVTGAIYHDFKKIDEYRSGPVEQGMVDEGNGFCHYELYTPIERTDYRDLVRHVAGSHAAFLVNLALSDDDEHRPSDETIMLIEHIILSHHGRRDAGSPIEPQRLEAHIVHFADMLSARYGNTRQIN